MKTLKTTILLGILSLGLSAQSDLMLYNFNAVAQSLQVNPALEQQTRVWVGLPGLSGVHAHYHNNGFKLIDLFEKDTEVNANKDKILLSLNDRSQIAFNQSTQLLGVGFRAFNGFVTLGATQNIDYRMTYPVDFLRLINFGNAPDEYRNLDVGGFTFESLVRTNYYVGYQRKVNDKLRLGGNFKFIVGQANTYVDKMKAKVVTTDSSSVVVETDALIRSGGISGFFDSEDGFQFGNSFFSNNLGFGVDLGASYDLNEKWNFSASIVDLGFINWKNNTRDYISNGRYVYDGLEANLSDDNPIQDFEDITDSLEAAFNFEEVDGNSYTKALSSRVFLGANYHLTDRHTFGLLYHGRIWENSLYNDFSANYQGKLTRWVQLSVSYSIINGTYNNVGAGLMLKLGPAQLYVMSDNVIHMLWYHNLQTTNIRAGLNITLFDKKEKSSKSDNTPAENSSGEQTSKYQNLNLKQLI
jgi:hypothetical protein